MRVGDPVEAAEELEGVAETVDGFPGSREVYRTRFVLMSDVSGEPRRREPVKVDGWAWYPWASLPEPLFAPVASLLRRS